MVEPFYACALTDYSLSNMRRIFSRRINPSGPKEIVKLSNNFVAQKIRKYPIVGAVDGYQVISVMQLPPDIEGPLDIGSRLHRVLKGGTSFNSNLPLKRVRIDIGYPRRRRVCPYRGAPDQRGQSRQKYQNTHVGTLETQTNVRNRSLAVLPRSPAKAGAHEGKAVLAIWAPAFAGDRNGRYRLLSPDI